MNDVTNKAVSTSVIAGSQERPFPIALLGGLVVFFVNTLLGFIVYSFGRLTLCY